MNHSKELSMSVITGSLPVNAPKKDVKKAAKEAAELALENMPPETAYAMSHKLTEYAKELGSQLKSSTLDVIPDKEGLSVLGGTLSFGSRQNWKYDHIPAWEEAQKELAAIKEHIKEIEGYARKAWKDKEQKQMIFNGEIIEIDPANKHEDTIFPTYKY